jgi:hypothetical protein
LGNPELPISRNSSKHGLFAVHEIDIAHGFVNKESDTRAYLTQHVLITSISNELDISFSMMKQCNCRATVLICEESLTEEKDKVSNVRMCTVGVKNRHGPDYVTYTAPGSFSLVITHPR